MIVLLPVPRLPMRKIVDVMGILLGSHFWILRRFFLDVSSGGTTGAAAADSTSDMPRTSVFFFPCQRKNPRRRYRWI